MATTTMEEARKCPRCGKYGKPAGTTPGPRGSKVHQFECKTEGCKWEDTKWIVQVNRDGSVPIRGEDDKEFQPLAEYQKQAARDRRRFHEAFMNDNKGEGAR